MEDGNVERVEHEFVPIGEVVPSPKEKLDALTSLRFFAAYFVVIGHSLELSPFFNSHFRMFNINYCVDFFFVLSGFVLCYQYGEKFCLGRFRFTDFLIKRAARLYPVHLITLLLYLLIFFVSHRLHVPLNSPEKYDFGALPFQFLMMQAWGFVPVRTFNMPAWSISAEWFAYLCFPIYLALAFRLAKNLLIGSLICSLAFIGFVLLSPSLFSTADISWVTWDLYRIIPEFLLGVFLCLIWQRTHLSPRLAWWLFLPAAAIWLASVYDQANNPYSATSVLAACAIIYTSATATRGRARTWLSWPVLIYGGEISYSIYMTHQLTTSFMYNFVPKLAGMDLAVRFDAPYFLISMLLVCVVAAIFYHFIEVPGKYLIVSRLGRHLGVKQPNLGRV